MDTTESVVVEPVGAGNWRAVVNVAARRDQELFAMPVAWYLALCQYEGLGWKPYAIRQGNEYVGFVMAAVDEGENAYWIGGFVVNAAHQRLGYGRKAMQILLKWGTEMGCDTAGLRFVDTGETSDDGIVARLQLPA